MNKHTYITDSDKLFDKKIFLGSLFFFFAALVNPRDFPIPNLPLIYPAFIFYITLFGSNKISEVISEGYRRTKVLILLLIIFWFYTAMLKVVKDIPISGWAYLFEPIMILLSVGMATSRPGGAKASLLALFIVIFISNACGIWIFFIGEPVTFFRSMLRWSIGGSLLRDQFIRDMDMNIDYATLFKINAGLSSHIFLFSYQLSIAITMAVIFILRMKCKLNIKYLLAWGFFIILFVGMVINTERATILSVSIGILTFFFISRKKIFFFRHIIFSICLIILFSFLFSPEFFGENIPLLNRLTNLRSGGSTINTRLIKIPIAAVTSVLNEPFGTGGSLSAHYKNVAEETGWFSSTTGEIQSSHNHYANVIMYAGIVGILLVGALFSDFWKRYKLVKNKFHINTNILLVALSVASLVHGLTHNAGFFRLESTTLIVLGLLWGTTSQSSNYYRKRL